MPSRRRRKRYRGATEAARGDRQPRRPHGVWGDATLGDVVLLRTAIREYWPVHPDVASRIIEDVYSLLDSDNVRFLISVTKTFLAITRANMEAERVLAKLAAEGHPEAAGAVRARPSQSGAGF